MSHISVALISAPISKHFPQSFQRGTVFYFDMLKNIVGFSVFIHIFFIKLIVKSFYTNAIIKGTDISYVFVIILCVYFKQDFLLIMAVIQNSSAPNFDILCIFGTYIGKSDCTLVNKKGLITPAISSICGNISISFKFPPSSK